MSVIKSLPPHIIKREHTTPNLRCTTTHPDTIFNLQNAHFLYEKLKYTDSRKYTRKYLTVHRLSINTINVHLESSDVHFLLTVQYNTVQYCSWLSRRGGQRFGVSAGGAAQSSWAMYCMNWPAPRSPLIHGAKTYLILYRSADISLLLAIILTTCEFIFQSCYPDKKTVTEYECI